MHFSHVLGAGAALAAFGWFFATDFAAPAAASTPVAPPIANGHYVLVVEGNRQALTITAASAKADPWAGVPKGLTSDWSITIHDGRGDVLAEIPLDVSMFATEAAHAGRGVRVEGCVVKDPTIGMLANVPAFAAAASYTFSRSGEAVELPRVLLGTIPGDTVRQLSGGGR